MLSKGGFELAFKFFTAQRLCAFGFGKISYLAIRADHKKSSQIGLFGNDIFDSVIRILFKRREDDRKVFPLVVFTDQIEVRRSVEDHENPCFFLALEPLELRDKEGLALRISQVSRGEVSDEVVSVDQVGHWTECESAGE